MIAREESPAQLTGFELQPLTPERLPDLLDFFDHRAFADNAKWASCYCACYFLDHDTVDWSQRGAAENRQELCCLAKSGQAEGWLAYRDGQVIAWLNASPRDRYPGFA